MNNKLNYIDTGNAVTLVADGKSYTIAASHPNYTLVMDALLAEDFDKAKNLANTAMAIKTYIAKDIQVKNGGIYYKNEKLGGAVVEKILTFMSEGRSVKPLIAFLSRLMANPSFGARERLYEFLASGHFPITGSGTFLAYKAVQSNYLSKTSGVEPVEVSSDGGKTWDTFIGHIPNNVGNIVKVDRSRVDDNPNNHCSYGLHLASHKYMEFFASGNDKIVIVEVDPADVVSVPTDHESRKARACKYKVIENFKGELTTSMVENTQDIYDGYEDDED